MRIRWGKPRCGRRSGTSLVNWFTRSLWVATASWSINWSVTRTGAPATAARARAQPMRTVICFGSAAPAVGVLPCDKSGRWNRPFLSISEQAVMFDADFMPHEFRAQLPCILRRCNHQRLQHTRTPPRCSPLLRRDLYSHQDSTWHAQSLAHDCYRSWYS